jgi:hypothetical protein
VGSIVWSAVRLIIVGVVAVILGLSTYALADYFVTIPGSGTTFASLVISTKHYAAMVLCDMTLGESTCTTVKAASTAPAGTDTALVTSLSPNSAGLLPTGQTTMSSSAPVAIASDQSAVPVTSADTLPSSGNITVIDSGSSTATGQNSVSIITGTPTAASFYTQAISATSTARFQVTGTWTGTLQFEGSVDGGTTWVPITAHGTGTVYNVATITGNGVFDASVSGLTNVRVRATAAMTGTAVARVVESGTVGPVYVNNPMRIVDNSNGTTLSLTTAGSSGTNLITVQGSTSGVGIPVGPSTSGGLSWYNVQPTAGDNHANIKNGAGQVYKISITNNSATINYIRLYNAGTGFNGCNSATNLVYENAIPASSSTAGGILDSIDLGLAFSTGISICVTAGYAQNDTTNATASAMNVGIGYK